jgi:hypothetical protein
MLSWTYLVRLDNNISNMMVGKGFFKFDCCLIVTASDDVNGKLIGILSEKIQCLKCCISRTECRLETKKICREQGLGLLFFLLTNPYVLKIFDVAKKIFKFK